MADMNRCTIMGRLTRDPELNYTTNTNTAVTKFTVANETGYGEKAKTSFINCVAWAKTAEFVSKYFRKGGKIALEGRIETRTWEDKHNQKRSETEVIVEQVYFVDSKKNETTVGEVATTVYENTNDDSLPF